MKPKNKTKIIRFSPLVIALAAIALTVTVDYALRSSAHDDYAQGVEDMAESKFDAAIEDFSHALTHNPADSAARFALGRAYESKGWPDEALKQYDMAIKASSDTFVRANIDAGLIYKKKGQKDTARTALKAALAVDPNYPGLNDLLRSM